MLTGGAAAAGNTVPADVDPAGALPGPPFTRGTGRGAPESSGGTEARPAAFPATGAPDCDIAGGLLAAGGRVATSGASGARNGSCGGAAGGAGAGAAVGRCWAAAGGTGLLV